MWIVPSTMSMVCSGQSSTCVHGPAAPSAQATSCDSALRRRASVAVRAAAEQDSPGACAVHAANSDMKCPGLR